MLLRIIKLLLLLTALTPLIFATSLIFPYVMGKALFFRVIVEAALILFLILLLLKPDFWQRFKQVAKTPLFLLVILFFAITLVSSFFAVDVYRSFFGDVERMEGVFGLLHYLAFFVIAVNLFKKNDWLNFIKLSLAVGAVLIFHGLYQVIFQNFDRAQSLLGNSSYLGTHSLFLLGLSLLLFWHSLERGFWYYAAALMVILSIVGVFISGTRGAIVGLVAGVIFLAVYYRRFLFDSKNLAVRLAFATAVALIVIFFLTRSAAIWQSIPGVDRIAAFSFNSSTVQTRLLAVGIGWDAFKERPLLGWGQDNFDIAYNKHHNPDYSLYELSWFDRAHNRLVDVAVMQGLLGLISYLAIFGWVLFSLVKFKNYRYSAPLLFVTVAYFTQNLFLFDQINSYLMFFAVLGIVAETQVRNKREIIVTEQNLSLNFSLLVAVAILVIALLYSLFSFNFVPWRQAKFFIDSLRVGDARKIVDLSKKFLTPNNFTQHSIRAQFMDFLDGQSIFDKPEFDFLGEISIQAMEEIVDQDPYYPRQYLRLASAYNNLGKRDKDKPGFYFKKAEEAMFKALELAPKRQDIYYQLAHAYLGQNEREKAIETARKAVELSPNVYWSRYVLGLILSLSGQLEEGEKEINKALELGFSVTDPIDIENLITIYSRNIVFYTQQRDLDNILKFIGRIKEINPNPEELDGDLKVIEELAVSGRWSELQQLIAK